MDNSLNKAKKDVSVDHCISNYNTIESKEVEIKNEPLEDNQNLLWIKKESEEEKQKCMRSVTTGEQKFNVDSELDNANNLSNTILQKTIYKDVKLEIKEEKEENIFVCVGLSNESVSSNKVLQKSINEDIQLEIKKEMRIITPKNGYADSHVKTDIETKPYHCSFCNKSFKHRVGLRFHPCKHSNHTELENNLRVHNGSSLYKCTHCERRFSNNIDLKTHLLIHKEQKPYGCSKLIKMSHRSKLYVNNPVFIEKEEKLIVRALLFTAKWGFPQGHNGGIHNEIKNMVQSFIRSTGRASLFKDDRPEREWIVLFEERHRSKLKKRTPELFATYFGNKLSMENVIKFKDMYEHVLKEKKMLEKPWAIFNIRETGLIADKTNHMVYVGKEVKKACICCPTNRKTIYTVLFCISASGEYLPPYTIYNAKNLCDSWTKGGPKGACYSYNSLGWMSDTSFESWFIDIFIKHVQHWEKPIILTFDGNTSHLTYSTVKAAIDNKIIIICTPPNTLRLLQPFDFGVYSSIKNNWKDILSTWFNETQLNDVCKDIFPTLLSRLWLRLNPSDVISGFMATGLYPKERPNAVESDPDESESSETSSNSSDSDEFEDSTSWSGLSSDSDIENDALELSSSQPVRLHIPDDNQNENFVSLPKCDDISSSEINHADHMSSHSVETVAPTSNLISETTESPPNITYSQIPVTLARSRYISSSEPASMSTINNKKRNRSLSPENTSSSKTVKSEDTLDFIDLKGDKEKATKCLL